MIKCGIYRIKNIINNNCYYGSSKNINKRWNRHKNELNKNKHHNVILQRAWNKYGENNFIFEIMEECAIDELLIKEQNYLNSDPIYNIGLKSSGGDNITNNPNRKDIVDKIKKSVIDRYKKLSKEEILQICSKPKDKNPNWKGGKSVKYCDCGKEISPNNKTCIKCKNQYGENNPFFNKKHSDNTKNKIREKRIGKYHGKQNLKFSIEGKIYNSLSEASKDLNIPITTIRWRIKSNNKKFYEYKYI